MKTMESCALNANYLSTDAKIELSLFLFSRGLYKNSVDAMKDIEEELVEIVEYTPDDIVIRIEGRKEWWL